MKCETLKVLQTDGHEIILTHDFSVTAKKGNILLLHGMAEHIHRYNALSSFLANQGYDVYRYSHRGHGTELKKEDLGFFSSKNGADLVVSDAISVLNLIKKNDTSPLFVMGHSMGSIIARNVIQQFHDLNGVILCGTANPKKFITIGGLFMTMLTGYYFFPKNTSPFMNKLMFGSSLYKSQNKRTNYDWLCSDPSVVDTYINDAYCGFICTKSFYHDLLSLTFNATNKKKILKTPKSIPIFIISGTEDAVGGCGKDVQKLIDFYIAHNYVISHKFYENMRHEILNDYCKEIVMSDILDFLNKSLT